MWATKLRATVLGPVGPLPATAGVESCVVIEVRDAQGAVCTHPGLARLVDASVVGAKAGSMAWRLVDAQRGPGTVGVFFTPRLAEPVECAVLLNGDEAVRSPVLFRVAPGPPHTFAFVRLPEAGQPVVTEASRPVAVCLAARDEHGNACVGDFDGSGLEVDLLPASGEGPPLLTAPAGGPPASSGSESLALVPRGDGLFDAALTAFRAGRYLLSAVFRRLPAENGPVPVHVLPGLVAPARCVLLAGPTPDAPEARPGVVARGVAGHPCAVLIRLRDAYGNLADVAYEETELTADAAVAGAPETQAQGSVPAELAVHNGGHLRAEFSTSLAGPYDVRASVRGVAAEGSPLRVLILPDEPHGEHTTVTLSGASSLVAGGTNELRVVVRDRHRNVRAGLGDTLTLKIRGPGPYRDLKVSPGDERGVHTASFRLNTAGQYVASVLVAGVDLSGDRGLAFSVAPSAVDPMRCSLSRDFVGDSMHVGVSGVFEVQVRDSFGTVRAGLDDAACLYAFFSRNGEPRTGGELRPAGEGKYKAVVVLHQAGEYRYEVFMRRDGGPVDKAELGRLLREAAEAGPPEPPPPPRGGGPVRALRALLRGRPPAPDPIPENPARSNARARGLGWAPDGYLQIGGSPINWEVRPGIVTPKKCRLLNCRKRQSLSTALAVYECGVLLADQFGNPMLPGAIDVPFVEVYGAGLAWPTVREVGPAKRGEFVITLRPSVMAPGLYRMAVFVRGEEIPESPVDIILEPEVRPSDVLRREEEARRLGKAAPQESTVFEPSAIVVTPTVSDPAAPSVAAPFDALPPHIAGVRRGGGLVELPPVARAPRPLTSLGDYESLSRPRTPGDAPSRLGSSQSAPSLSPAPHLPGSSAVREEMLSLLVPHGLILRPAVVLIIIENSGFGGDDAWAEFQDAVVAMIRVLTSAPHIQVCAVIYGAERAVGLPFPAAELASAFASMPAGLFGAGACLHDAFERAGDMFNRLVSGLDKEDVGPGAWDAHVVLITSVSHSCTVHTTPVEAFHEFRSFLRQREPARVVGHAVAVGPYFDLEWTQRVRATLGTEPGVMLCPAFKSSSAGVNADGSSVLQERCTDLATAIAMGMAAFDVEVAVPDPDPAAFGEDGEPARLVRRTVGLGYADGTDTVQATLFVPVPADDDALSGRLRVFSRSADGPRLVFDAPFTAPRLVVDTAGGDRVFALAFAEVAAVRFLLSVSEAVMLSRGGGSLPSRVRRGWVSRAAALEGMLGRLLGRDWPEVRASLERQVRRVRRLAETRQADGRKMHNLALELAFGAQVERHRLRQALLRKAVSLSNRRGTETGRPGGARTARRPAPAQQPSAD